MTKLMPIEHGFEYEVSLTVSLPTRWTRMLKEIASVHYDYKCRNAGKSGVINALHNTARDGRASGTHYAVTWSDLDLIAKVVEQAVHHSEEGRQLATEINMWLRVVKDKIQRRHAQLVRLL